MIERKKLLVDLKPLLKEIEADLRARCDEVAEIDGDLRREYEQARKAERTGVTFEQWRADLITQVAAAWVLSCVFVRFLEDNALITPPRISGLLHGAGQDAGLQRARDERETYFRTHPRETDRDYLLAVFDDLAKLPGAKDVFGPHNPVNGYRNWLSGDAAQKLIEFFQKIDGDDSGEIVHDFTDPAWDTRFLGDLYQDLSEAARKKYALLQTPIFVEEFILDRTLEPAIEEFGLRGENLEIRGLELRGLELRNDTNGASLSSKNQALSTKNQALSTSFRMIDPACGSGHFLLGSFARILKHWRAKEPGSSDRELVNRALASLHGVDINPYAVAIARFRLLLVAMRECQITKLKDSPAFAFNLVCGDSLLHGSPGGEQHLLDFHELAHVYQSEDLPELQRILKAGQYHAVVANPPYITVKDKALNQAYRERYPEVCHMKYSLSVPFMQRLFVLACEGGLTGQITANSFMKREFGKKLIESYLPSIDLTHVIDTSGAYIPGHGTPTVILFGRRRRPVAPTVRAVMGIKGEPATPEDPATGLVWSAILDQIDRVGSQSAFVSVNDTPREQFGKHPWSIGGGGAAELKELLDEQSKKTLRYTAAVIGIFGMTNADEVMLAPDRAFARFGVEPVLHCPLVIGDQVRDWIVEPVYHSLFPYHAEQLLSIEEHAGFHHWIWPCRTVMGSRATFGKSTYFAEGRPWWEWHQVCLDRLRTPLSIVFGEVATHNHFVLDRGGKVFKQTAPVIKLPATAGEDDHLALLGLLNSSTACFWMRQVCFPKGGDHVGQEGARVRKSIWDERHAFNATNLERFPLPAERPLTLAKQLDQLAGLLVEVTPARVLQGGPAEHSADILGERKFQWQALRWQMIALQEELDWECYRLYGLTDKTLTYSDTPPTVELGQRAFEIVLARRMAEGEVQTTWFERHGTTPITEIPADWPKDYRRLVEQRIELIETDRNIGLIEQPEYKRRWNTEPWDSQLERALRNWLLDRLESYFDFDGRMSNDNLELRGVELGEETGASARSSKHYALRTPPLANIQLVSVARLSDVARADKDFMQVAEIFTGRMDFDVGTLVGELVAAESVPALPILRYKPAAMDKRAAWERTWDLQRREDAVDALFEELITKARGLEGMKEVPASLFASIGSSWLGESAAKANVIKELEEAADYLAGAVKQKLDLTKNTILKPVQDAAKRAKKAAVGDIPVPPKYTSSDFRSSSFWRLRGKLDVPKERWVSFPYCEGEDGTLVVAWAGYDHLQLARAIAERYELAKEQEGRRLVPLLAAIGQLIPWLKQWHNELDPVYGTRMGDYFENYLAEEAKSLGMSVEVVMAWGPPEKAKSSGRKKKVKA